MISQCLDSLLSRESSVVEVFIDAELQAISDHPTYKNDVLERIMYRLGLLKGRNYGHDVARFELDCLRWTILAELHQFFNAQHAFITWVARSKCLTLYIGNCDRAENVNGVVPTISTVN